ncbi:hypothetical protein [Geoalkalibacter halelectricus]|uniref:PEP-CTERM protein-sorting domain-containing protein n=1 Tax=Geoalkalibacter halelectricus TaxID=2847045 RepID=A0ABY5ZMU7_9BACT|nr:hypothetical protein [Geoalkalibacter halelectricus]MDO3378274.1 hypothetical protein [Geoalkalibacter halelectricus]UWZ79135.1 hypothetical protein L9S41_15835 [Geoalkalibacter halelectricus]
MANLWARGSKLFFVAVVIGAVLLGVFKAFYPEVPAGEVLGVIVLFAMGLAAVIQFFWGSWKKSKDNAQGE